MNQARAMIALFVAMTAAAAGAQTRPASTAFERMVKCRELAADKERLACFDAAAAELTAAVDRKEVAVVSREEVREAKRSLFGITLPNLKLFGGGDGDQTVDEISTAVRSVSEYSPGRYTFVLAEGGTWQTVEAARFPPETGDTALIRRAALGSFLAKFSGGRAVRVQRVR